MNKKMIFSIVMLWMSLSAYATGQDGDVIYMDGIQWELLGKPVYVTDNLPTAAAPASGDTVLYYGDFSGLAVKTGESAEIQMLLEKYAEQHALGFVLWLEIDNAVENAQKIVKGSIVAAG